MNTPMITPAVINEQDAFIALNKPAGLLVHPTQSAQAKHTASTAPGSGREETLVDWLLEHYQDVANVGDDPELRPGIVHRLDRETSGIMLVARTQEAFEHFKRQFKKRLVKKHYIALVTGSPSKENGTIDRPISRVGIKRVVGAPRDKAKDAKDAKTHWSVQKRFHDVALLNVEPETGRTNQIRVHLASINHPIVCDPVYGGKAVRCPAGLNRLFLHAASLEILLPNGERATFEAPLPDDLQETLKELEKE